MPRFFVSQDQIDGDYITITGDDARHMKTVLRCHIEDEITVCDGHGIDYHCKIDGFESGDIQTVILKKELCQSEPQTKIVLYQGLPKADKMELIIQKCTEIGVTRIVPVATKYAVAKLDNKESKKIERWQKIAESAAKQSGRGLIPQIGPNALSFTQAIDEASVLSGTIIPYEKEDKVGIKQFVAGRSDKTIGVFIGPEGGFAEEEIALAIKAGITPITLGKRILRTETAGIVSIALLLHELG